MVWCRESSFILFFAGSQLPLGSLVVNQLIVNVRVYFWALTCVSLICMSSLIQFYTLFIAVASLEIGRLCPLTFFFFFFFFFLTFFFFFKIVFVILGPLPFNINFRSSHSQSVWKGNKLAWILIRIELDLLIK